MRSLIGRCALFSICAVVSFAGSAHGAAIHVPGVKLLIAGGFPRHSEAWCSARLQAVGAELKTKRGHLPYYMYLADLLACAGRAGDAVVILNAAKGAPVSSPTWKLAVARHQWEAGDFRAAAATVKSVPVNSEPVDGQGWMYAYIATKVSGRPSKPQKLAVPLADDMYGPSDEGAEPLLTLLMDDLKAAKELQMDNKAPWVTTAPAPVGAAAWLKSTHPTLLDSGAAVTHAIAWLIQAGGPSPAGWEMLGDLLRYSGKGGGDAPELAAWAYLRASEATGDRYAKLNYIAKAGRAAAPVVRGTLGELLARFEKARQQGVTFTSKLHATEATAAKRGSKPALRFSGPANAKHDRALAALVASMVPACEKSRWGNPRKLNKSSKAQRAEHLVRSHWTGLGFADVVHRFGLPRCFFRGQWLWGKPAIGEPSSWVVWLKYKNAQSSAVVRLLAPPGP